ncbi:hypothetical protein SAMN04488542_103215 [Fontibacillus panacisegetis]|uniref:PD-(D/E)XK endonuclease-like domain-containing protein n=1 Tax=Fontibacillus panacisegetis TaxID=670482 RepID=A0A1G7GVB8_9BACL|nr:hypothetical protein [Fontibacillus panacisegetis]SDE92097.1 hypothetical protein SAMN04488542_103215 [Fontibacillus panacisegetis]
MPYLCTYENSRPSDALIKQEMIMGKSYLYVTATKALARERKELIPRTQIWEDKKCALFNDFLKGVLKEKGVKFATRGEEKTFLKRALKEVAADDILLHDLFHKDTNSFLRVFYDLATQGIDLRYTSLPQEKLDCLVNPELGRYLIAIHNSFHNEMKAKNRELFETAARKFLLNGFAPESVVIMEGFTFFTELQKLFVQTCLNKKIQLYFVVPLNPNQPKGFEIISNTYSSVPNITNKVLETDPNSKKEDLNFLQSNLFSDNTVNYAGDTSNIIIKKYPNRDREMLACIDQLQVWFADKTYKPDDVVIVMRRSKEFIDRFRDHLAMNPLLFYSDSSSEPIPVTLSIQPRLLLLTPVGRFVLTLYRIWENGNLKLTMDELETILASGWLGPRLQDSASLFRSVKHQYFSDCETQEQWNSVLERLILKHKTQYKRLPLHLLELDHHTLARWKEVVSLLESACVRLFVRGQKTIASHIELLQAEMKKLLPKRLRREEQEVLEQIQQVFEELGSYYSIDITSSEFGEAIHALTRGTTEQEEEDEDNNNDNDDHGKEDHRLSIVTPETLDGINKPAVLYVAVDSQHSPVLYSESWPFYEDNRENHMMKERYMFLTVIRSASEKLWLSYSSKDGERAFQKSVYLGEIERLMNKPTEVSSIFDQLDISLAKVPPVFPPPPPARRKRYELNELAHYGLCPLRYRLELLHPEAMVYRTEWQLNIVAKGIWLDKIYTNLAQYTGEWPNPRVLRSEDEKIDGLFRFLLEAKKCVKDQVTELFPTFDSKTWVAVERQVEDQLQFHASKRGLYPVRIIDGENEEFDVTLPSDDNKIISFNVPNYLNSGILTIPLLDYELSHEWLLSATKKQDETRAQSIMMKDIDGVEVFETLFDAVSWWRLTIQSHVIEKFQYKDTDYTRKTLSHKDSSEEQLANWIVSIEENKFPKHAGKHCTTCPVRMECLGIGGGE